MSILGSTSLFFFASSIVPPPQIGSAYGGGFFAGYISHTANGVATHALIVAPRATGATGDGYTLGTNKIWKTSNTQTAGTTSSFDGAANSANMNNASHPAAQFCENLSIGGYTDWYLPARYEVDIAYQLLKPTTAVNNTDWGINPYSVPARASNRTAGTPAQTAIAIFKSDGAEAFIDADHWTSTESTAFETDAWKIDFHPGSFGQPTKDSSLRVRAFRRVAL